MCAARVLPEFYDHVTVYERDDLPDRPANRAAVPQGRHVHLLMPRGAQEFERLYPGRLDGMVAEGCRSWRTAPTASTSARRDTCWAPGTPLREEFTAYVPEPAAAGMADPPAHDPVAQQVTGVLLDAEGDHEKVAADLAVDAAGRGTRLPAWLAQWALQRPPADTVDVGRSLTPPSSNA